MTESLNISLALAKQAFDELLSLAAISEVEKFEFEPSPKRDRIEALLKKLNDLIAGVDRTLSNLVSDSDDPPLLSLPTVHRKTYDTIVVINGPAIQRAHLKAVGLGNFLDILDTPDDASPKPYRLNALSFALERWQRSRDESEDEFEWSCEWCERGFDIDGAAEIVRASWFRPDQWAQNLRLLRPVLIDRRPDVLNNLARHRLTEVYRTFAFGLWLASIALSRSLVEYSIKANAGRLNIDLIVLDARGRKDDKPLWQLQQEVAERFPQLTDALETVRLSGNRILHPSKHDVVSHPTVLRSESLACLLATKDVVEALYSELPRQ